MLRMDSNIGATKIQLYTKKKITATVLKQIYHPTFSGLLEFMWKVCRL